MRDLRPVSLDDARRPGQRVMTMSVGQWDALLAAAYERGWILLELDAKERPVRAYQKSLGHLSEDRRSEIGRLQAHGRHHRRQ